MTAQRLEVDCGATAAFRRVLESALTTEAARGPTSIVLATPSGRQFYARCSACGSSPRRHADRRMAVVEAEAEAEHHVCRGTEPGQLTATPADEVLVASRSRAGIEYRVTFGIDGAAVCTCAGWEFRATCPHIEIARRSR